MRARKIKPAAIRQSMLLAGLILASAGVQAAALPKITVTGVVDSGIAYLNGYAGPIAYDPSAWFGKTYTLELTPDVASVVGQSYAMDDIPGEYENIWSPANVSYRLTIDGVVVFSGVDNQWSEVATLNDVTVPPGLTDVPPGILDNHTYDDYWVSTSGIDLGCFSCGGASGDVYEYGSLQFERFWDLADGYDAIADANHPDLFNLDFNQGFGSAGFVVGHYSTVTNQGDDRALISFGIDSVTVAAVPEPETYAMLLAGLGLVGWVARRRNKV